MKRYVLSILVSLFFVSSAWASSELPLTLAGFTLGQDVDQYSECCDIKLASPIPDAPYLKEVHLRSDFRNGIRGGSLTSANCDQTGKLVRIKLKFHERGKRLFEELLELYTESFGKPDEYKGNSFRNIIAWQWNFEEDGKRVSLLLMWSREKEMRPGVSIKMTYDSLVDSEYECFRKLNDMNAKRKGSPSRIRDINEFVPR